MAEYIKFTDDNSDSLTHYGVKGMKWRHHKNRNNPANDLYSAVSGATAEQQALAEIHNIMYKKKKINEEADRRVKQNLKNRGGNYRPISREVKVSGKGKGIKRRKKVGVLNAATPEYTRDVRILRQHVKDYIALSRSTKKGKKYKNASSLGKSYIKDMRDAFKSMNNIRYGR